MNIRCPRCNKRGETEVEPERGRPLRCPFCSEKFLYAGDATILAICPQCGSSEELPLAKEGIAYNCKQCGCLYVAKHCDLSQLEEVKDEDPPPPPPPALPPPNPPPEEASKESEVAEEKFIECKCPHCGCVYEIAERKIGDTEVCDECGETFVVAKREKPKLTPCQDSKPVLKPVAKPVLRPVAKPILKPVAKTATVPIAKPRQSVMPSAQRTEKTFGGGRFISKKQRFCRECGGELNPAKPRCPHCGAISIAETSSARISRMAGGETNHIGMAIAAVLLCFPLGIVALVFALQAQSRRGLGDDYGAEEAARTAHACAKIGIILGLIGWVGWFFWWLYVSYQADKVYQNMMREQRELERTIQNINYYY